MSFFPTIIIIRHGEKLPWPQGNPPSKEEKENWVDDKNLSGKGYERADALVSYFTKRQEITSLNPIGAIFAQVPNAHNKKSQSKRPLQTVQPLSEAIKIPITGYEHDQFKDLMHDILTPNKYAGKTVIISWEHKAIATDLLPAFGVDKSKIIPHPKNSFDITYIVTVHENKTADYIRIPQRLLYLDSEKVPDDNSN